MCVCVCVCVCVCMWGGGGGGNNPLGVHHYLKSEVLFLLEMVSN